jgi:hypothetical protein
MFDGNIAAFYSIAMEEMKPQRTANGNKDSVLLLMDL